jgi:SARP family transcriptional regulator, regulator of embCAB operon
LNPGASTRIQLCGRLVVVWQGIRVEDRLPSRQGRVLFAYLAVNRQRARSRAEIVESIWPNNPPNATGSALNALLSKLRTALGRDAVTGLDEPRLRLPADSFVDLDHANECLHIAESAAALGEWHRAWAPARAALHTASRGFLPGHEAPWIDELRRSLEEMRRRALECVAATGNGLGGPELASAERAARAIVECAPLSESGYLHLMRALSERHRVPEALLVYEQLRARLRDELGIVPSALAQQAHAELLNSRSQRQVG